MGEQDVHSKPSSMEITVDGKTADLKGMAHMQGTINLQESKKKLKAGDYDVSTLMRRVWETSRKS